MSVDWGLGRYERTAAQLLPAARAVIERAAPAPGEQVVDVGCGTGNAALLAAERGARVTGVDPAARLLEVAAGRAAAQGLDATFSRGDAASLPVADGTAGLTVSVFGAIFAPDPTAAAAEMARVTAPGGRIALSAWLPDGAVARAVRAAREAAGAAGGPPPFPWHEQEALSALFAPHGFDVTVEHAKIGFTAGSARELVEQELANHPIAVATRPALERRGEAEALPGRMVAIYEAANEDPDAFRVTSRYVIALARRRG
ncbi:class I SAM-dependent methyltransferase [Candidatus Solirubrobacter pratensis]|uniref:class I SAM-dependent methyltransferase n=1 Tax=Candidatus Solirubrobacter pratensis TaxID=1298857 RepID=UPI0004068273|nr:class I SAM-dependent methyltransferase [Candidatus Solirubrobacter pratensis]